MQIHTSTARAIVVFCLAGALFLPSCIIKVEGESSGKMKKNLLDSYLFRSLDLFYPEGMPDDAAAYPTLASAQLKTVERDLTANLVALTRYHQERIDYLNTVFEPDAKADVVAHLRVTNTGLPIARSEHDGEITVDIKVAQALFRAALASAYDEGSFDDPLSFGDAPAAEAAAADDSQALQAFFDLRAEVRGTKGHTLIGDLFDSGNLDGSWFDMADFQMTSMSVATHYSGPILFMLAHEVGHLSLDHHAATRLDGSCEGRRKREQQADIYAALLLEDLAATVNPLSAIFPGADMFGSENLLGYETFFQLAYGFAEFEQGGTTSDCAYLPPEVREAAVAEVIAALRSERVEQTYDALEAAFEEQANAVEHSHEHE